MELRHLRYFVAVAEELHFGRAARRLGIAQPPLSQQIRRLEDELGAALLRRNRRRVELTVEGEIFLDQARATLAQAARAVQAVRSARAGTSGRLAIGVVPWTNFTSVPGAIRVFGDRYPNVEIELCNLTTPDQLPALRDGRIDVAFTRPPLRGDEVVIQPVLSEPLVVMFPRGHPFTAQRRVPWRLLAGERYIQFSGRRAPGFDGIVADGCRRAGVTLSIRHEADHPQTVLALIEAGVGVSLVPASAARATSAGVLYRPLRPMGPRLGTILVWLRATDSPLVRAFASVVREVMRDVRRADARDSAQERGA